MTCGFVIGLVQSRYSRVEARRDCSEFGHGGGRDPMVFWGLSVTATLGQQSSLTVALLDTRALGDLRFCCGPCPLPLQSRLLMTAGGWWLAACGGRQAMARQANRGTTGKPWRGRRAGGHDGQAGAQQSGRGAAGKLSARHSNRGRCRQRRRRSAPVCRASRPRIAAIKSR